MKRLEKLIFGGISVDVFRGMATLATGTLFGRLIGVLAIPILTRIYSPAEFGGLAVFTAMVAIVAPLGTLRYTLSIPLPDKDEDAINIFALSILLIITTITIFGITLFFLKEEIFNFLSIQVLLPFWWFCIVAFFANASHELLSMWATRKRGYGIIAKSSILLSATSTLTKISFGFAKFSLIGLLMGQVFAHLICAFNFLYQYRSDLIASRDKVALSRIKSVAWKYRSFPIFRIPSQALMVISMQAPLIFFNAIYNPDVAGQLALAFTTLALPVALIGHTTSKAFYAEAANVASKDPQRVKLMLVDILKKISLIAVVPSAVLLFSGDIIFPIFFGAEWKTAGVYASNLSWYLLFQFLQTPVANVFYIFNGQKQLLLINLQRFILVLFVFGISIQLKLTPELTVTMYSLVISAHYALSTLYAVSYIPKKGQE